MDRKGTKSKLARASRAPKKRAFRGNQHVQEEAEAGPPAGRSSDSCRSPSTSRRKLRTSDEFLPALKNNFLYVLLEFFSVFSVLSELVNCKNCGGNVTFGTNGHSGLGFNIEVICDKKCQSRPPVISSCPVVRRAFEVNLRIQFAMRLLGVAHAGLKLFCGIMDMRPPLSKSNFSALNKKLHAACETVAEHVMRKAAAEEKDATIKDKVFEDPAFVGVSLDGTWMKRGFSSLFGAVIIIGQRTGKVLDACVKSSYCKVCELWEKKDHQSAEYQQYVDEHWPACGANHDGSAGSMEVKAAVQLSQRSEESRGLIYHDFIGDGDAKTYKAVVEEDPYAGRCNVVKKKCVGHVGKRMGTRLRNLAKDQKLGGRGGLIGKEIDKLSSYYGNAIRQNPEDADKMRDAIWATWYHRSSTDAKPQQHLCPVGEDSWCEWQRAQALGTVGDFKHDVKLPQNIMEAIKPVYESLSNPDLLQRCLGAHTQNANESFNSTLWRIAPKCRFSGHIVVEMACSLAECLFNEGRTPLMAILDELGVTVGEWCAKECRDGDAFRMEAADRKDAAATKEARTELRRAHLAAQDTTLHEEGMLYGPGID